MAVNDVFYATVNHTLGLGQKVQWGIHYVQLASTSPNPNEAEALAATLFDTLDTGNYLDFLMDSAIWDNIEVVQVTGGGQFALEVVNFTGDMTGQQLPPQVAPLISFYTDSIGRNQHARVYFPPPNETSNDAGALEGSFQVGLQLLAESLIVLQLDSVDTWNAVVFHRDNETHDNIEFAVVREDFKTQRRRVVGVGV